MLRSPSLRKYWSIFKTFRSLSLQKMTAYRQDFFFWVFVNTLWTAFNFFFFSLIINLNAPLAGWARWELYLLLGFFTMLDSAMWGIMNVNLSHFTQLVFNGELSGWMTKPIDLQFFAMTSKNTWSSLPRFFIGLAAVIVALQQLEIVPSLLQIFLTTVALLAGFVFLYSLWMILACLSFFVEKLDNINEIIPSFRRIWQLPSDVYSGFFSTFFTVLVPLALLTTVPTELILGTALGWQLIWLCTIALIALILSRFVLQYSIRHYTSVGG